MLIIYNHSDIKKKYKRYDIKDILLDMNRNV